MNVLDLLCMPPHKDSDRRCQGARSPGYVTILANGKWHCNYCGAITEAPEGTVIP